MIIKTTIKISWTPITNNYVVNQKWSNKIRILRRFLYKFNHTLITVLPNDN